METGISWWYFLLTSKTIEDTLWAFLETNEEK